MKPVYALLLTLLPACQPRVRTSPVPQMPPEPAANFGLDAIGTGLPAVPAVVGSLAITVVYPSATDLVDARDSSFLFGSVGTGLATLSINGAPVRVWPNGAWIAWVALPPDSIMHFDLRASTATDSAQLGFDARRLRRRVNPSAVAWIDSTAIVPAGRVWWPRDEFLPVVVRAVEGAQVRIRLPGGTYVPLQTDRRPEEIPEGIRAFDRDTLNLTRPARADRYLGVIRGVAIGASPGPILGGDGRTDGQADGSSKADQARIGASSGDSGSALPTGSRPCRRARRSDCPSVGPPVRPPIRPSDDTLATIEAIVGSDTARVRWNIRLAMLDTLPIVTELDDDTARSGTTDRITVGRAKPGATYNWFFPTGTRSSVSGRIGDDLRLRLSRGSEAWVPAADAQPLPPGTPGIRATVGSATLHPGPDRVGFRIPLSQRVPFQVTEADHHLALRLYSAVGDVDWIRYGGSDSFVKLIQWSQPTADEVEFDFDLAGPAWGYRTRWEQNDLILEIRRPPRIEPAHPLAGLLIEVDPGHPPLGATGPTGLREAEANLSVALRLRDLLQQAGARVVMTRTADSAVDLLPRIQLAESLSVDLLVSIHNNALPDGVEPFRNNGTSVFYNHPQSLPLARSVERALVRRLGIRELGVGRGDLALVRPTWMPAILCEGLFMMLPDQEAALRSPEGQRRYAVAVLEGMVEFLKQTGTTPIP